MFDDLPGRCEPEDVDAGVVMVARPMLQAMQDDKVALGDHTMDCHVLARPFTGHALEICDEPVDAVRHMRIVLDIDVADITLDRLAGATLVEHQFIEGDDVGLVAMGVGNDILPGTTVCRSLQT